MFAPLAAARRSARSASLDPRVVAVRAPRVEPCDLLGFGLGRGHHDRVLAGRQRRGLGIGERVHADDDLLAALDRLEPAGVGFDELGFKHARLDRLDRAAHRVDSGDFRDRLALQPGDQRLDLLAAVENVAELEQVGLIGHDLLQAQRPLLVERPRQAERLVPRGQLHRAGARLLRQDHRQHLDEDAIGVVLGLLLREPERIDLDAVAEAALGRILHAEPVAGDLVPKLDEGAHLGELGHEAHARVDEERNPPDDLGETRFVNLARLADPIEHGDRCGERVGKLLDRRRPGFLQMVGAHVHRVPLRRLAGAEQDHVLGQPERGVGREDVGSAGQIFLDDVVLGRALKLRARRALLVGDRDIEGHQPGRGGVDGHRRVHRRERNVLEQGPHVADVGDRDADLADLAARQDVIAVEAGLGRQVEGDRQPRLSLGEVLAVELVRFPRGRMAGVGAEDPGLVAGVAASSLVRSPAPSSARLGRWPAGVAFARAEEFVHSTITENSARRHDPPRHRRIAAGRCAASAFSSGERAGCSAFGDRART